MADLALPATGARTSAARARPAREHGRWTWTTRAFGVVAWGLALHILAMVVLFGALGLDKGVVRAIALWKEMAVIALLLAALIRAVAGRAPAITVRGADMAALTLGVLALVHATAMLTGAGPTSSTEALVYGLRDSTFFLVPLALGRLTPELFADARVLRVLFAVGALTAAVAVVEWLVVTPDMLVVLGVASYFNDFLDTAAYTANNDFGLPDNYWTMVGGRVMQRAGSVYMSSQGFAVPFLVIIPAATVWMTLRRRWTSPLAVAAFALLWLGLLLSITRMTIAACLVQTVIVILLARRPGPLVALGVAGAATAAALLVAVPGVAAFVWETVTWQSGSSVSHSKDYVNGLAAMWDRPLGNGLGTADMTAVRLGLVPLTADNHYLKLGVELGLPAALAYMALLGTLVWRGVAAALHGGTARARAAGTFLASATAGVAINGVTAVLTSTPVIALLFYWLAGAAFTTVDAEARDRG